jgi:hypothetical protein
MDKSLMQDLLQNTDDKVLAKLWNSFDDNESMRDSLHKLIREVKNSSLEIRISETRIEPIELSDMIKKAIQDRPWINELMTHNWYYVKFMIQTMSKFLVMQSSYIGNNF